MILLMFLEPDAGPPETGCLTLSGFGRRCLAPETSHLESRNQGKKRGLYRSSLRKEHFNREGILLYKIAGPDRRRGRKGCPFPN